MQPKNILAVLAFGIAACLVSGSNCGDSSSERQCGNDPTKLWLDIVIVVDNAKGMTEKGINDVQGQVVSIFDDQLLLGIRPDEPRTTRVGIVTYNSVATVNADLNKFDSIDNLGDAFGKLKLSNDGTSYLSTGLVAAENLLNAQSFNTQRDHYRKLLIVYTSEYTKTGTNDPVPVSRRLKASGVSIAVVAFSQDQFEGSLQQLEDIATPGFNFTNTNNDKQVEQLRDAMLQVNCYCPNGWTQLRKSFSDVNSERYGSCLTTNTLTASYLGAKISCRGQWNNAYLVNELTEAKHDYVLQLVRNDTHFTQPYTYWIGLTYSSGNWNWEQPSGQSPVQLQGFVGWLPGYPSASSTKTAVVNQQPSSSDPNTVGWVNTDRSQTWMYVCEVISCDSTNYCDAEDE